MDTLLHHDSKCLHLPNWSFRCCSTAEANLTRILEDAGAIPGLHQWVKDLVLRELQCRLQMRLRSGVTVSVV